MIIETVVDWQQQHPAVRFGMKQDSCGLDAFRRFMEDIRNPETRAQVDAAGQLPAASGARTRRGDP
jgi:hypothetical protein